MLPHVDKIFVTIIAVIAVLSILWGAFMALSQKDIKKLVAYSSVSHMGFVTLGAVAFTWMSIQGAMFQQFSHGIITCVLFMSAGTIQHSAGTRVISELGGLADRMPKFAFIIMAGFLASLGLPGMSGFVAEFMGRSEGDVRAHPEEIYQCARSACLRALLHEHDNTPDADLWTAAISDDRHNGYSGIPAHGACENPGSDGGGLGWWT
jgi:hypothetical protein